MTHKLIGEYGGVVEYFYDIDGQGRDLCKHHPPQRVCGLEVEVLDDEVGALVIGLRAAVLVDGPVAATKRAVYLQEAHVDCAAFWVVIHRVLLVKARRLCGCNFARCI
jgi:hypothetical protein